MSKDVVKLTSPVVGKQTLRAVVIRACRHCGAPGFWHDTPNVNVGCYAPEKVTMLGRDWVGPICPQCGSVREDQESVNLHRRMFRWLLRRKTPSRDIDNLGIIWSRESRLVIWRAVLHNITAPFKWRSSI